MRPENGYRDCLDSNRRPLATLITFRRRPIYEQLILERAWYFILQAPLQARVHSSSVDCVLDTAAYVAVA